LDFSPLRTTKKIELASFETELKPAKQGCGTFDYVDSYKAVFNEHALEQYVDNIVDGVVASAPLVLACYASPTLCDAFKHFKAMANGTLETAFGRCEAIQDAAMDWGKSLYAQEKRSCLDEKSKSGMSINQALAACDALSSLTSFTGVRVEEMHLIDDAMDLLGEQDPAIRNLAKGVFGDLTVSGEGRLTDKRSDNGIRILFGKIRSKKARGWDDVIRKLKKKQAITGEDLKVLSVPNLPISRDVVRAVASLPPAKQQIAIQSLVQATAMAELQSKVNGLSTKIREAEIAGGRTNPELAKELRAKRQKAQEELRLLLAEQEQAKRVADTVLNVLHEAERDQRRVHEQLRRSAAASRRARERAGSYGRYGGLTIYDGERNGEKDRE